MSEQQLCRHQGQWRRRGRRCSRCQSRDSPAARGEDHGEAGCPPAPMDICQSRYLPAARGGPHTWAHGRTWGRPWPRGKPALEQAPGRTCGPAERRAHAGAGLLAGLVTPWGTHAGAVCSWRTAPRGWDPLWSGSWRTVAHGKDSRWRSSWRTVSRGRDPTLEQGKSVRSPPPEEEGEAETTCDELTATPIPIPLHRLQGAGRENREQS